MGKRFFFAAVALLCGSSAILAGGARFALVDTTLDAFFQPGSQPLGGVVYEDFRNSANCANCHAEDEGTRLKIHDPWRGSMMAHAARDPLFHACLAIANQDAAFAGDLCIRCHTPGGWISGRSEPTDGSALVTNDYDGVSCSICHRMVDPEYKPGVSPSVDAGILANIDPLPTSPGGGNYVLDPNDRRRGPLGFADQIAPPGHMWLESPFHQTAALCGTCHDVNNPLYLRQADGSYAITDLDEPHPTGDKYDMFPIERTYSEWLMSDFADGGVDLGGRFGGNLTIVSTCQDCHMPRTTGQACNHPYAIDRDGLPSHELNGGNTWIPDVLIRLCDPANEDRPDYCPTEGMDVAALLAGKERAVSMLQRAADLDIWQMGNRINVRVTNQTGHKLPSGYPEGRRMWLNVRLFDASDALIDEFGHYDGATADLITDDTRVYEMHLGVDAAVSAVTGIAEGESFHFVLNNKIYKDNRIPPRGFTKANFRSVQAEPVGAYYEDGQFWDDAHFRLMDGAASVTVNLYYQTASKEYVTFLRDENITNDAGQILYDQWEQTGMSAPVLMNSLTVAVGPFADGDSDGNGVVNLVDYAEFIDCHGGHGVEVGESPCAKFDFDDDGDVDGLDYRELHLLID